MLRKILTLSLTVVWALAVVAAYYVGRNKQAREIEKALNQQRQSQSGRFSPGDRDPRGN